MFEFNFQTQIRLKKAEILTDILSTVQLQTQPFFTTDTAGWGTLLPPNWASDDPPPSGMLEILRVTSTPIWAVSTTVSTQLADLQMTYFTFLTMEASIQGIVSNPPKLVLTQAWMPSRLTSRKWRPRTGPPG